MIRSILIITALVLGAVIICSKLPSNENSSVVYSVEINEAVPNTEFQDISEIRHTPFTREVGEEKNSELPIRSETNLPHIDLRLIEEIKRKNTIRFKDNSKRTSLAFLSGKTNLELGFKNDYEIAIFVFEDEISIPKFHEPKSQIDLDSIAKVEALKAKMIYERSLAYIKRGAHPIHSEIAEYDGILLDRAWIIDAYLVAIPVTNKNIDKMLEQHNRSVPIKNSNSKLLAIYSAREYVRKPKSKIVKPTPSALSISEAADLMNLAPYKDFSRDLSWSIGMIDTGVWTKHNAFNTCSHKIIKQSKNCDHWSTNCAFDSDEDNASHGTPVASILNSCLEADSLESSIHGLTHIPVSSYGFPGSGSDHDKWLVIQAIQKSVERLDKVINISLDFDIDTATNFTDINSVDAISMAADAAFEAGVVVIAAAGNLNVNQKNGFKVKKEKPWECSKKTSSQAYTEYPAEAKRVLSVGADFSRCSKESRRIANGHLHGCTIENLYKPEMLAYTCSVAAMAVNDEDLVAEFGGTSGAAPFISAAAALLRSWYIETLGHVPDPGQIYAMLILSGKKNGGERSSAGTQLLKLPKDGILKFGEIDLLEGIELQIPFPRIDSDVYEKIDVALWWPEKLNYADDSNKYASEIYINISQNGDTKASSKVRRSIYQRADFVIDKLSDAPSTSELTVHIQGNAISHGKQKVYWAAFLKKREG